MVELVRVDAHRSGGTATVEPVALAAGVTSGYGCGHVVSVAVTARIPGFESGTTLWCTDCYDGLDLDAIQASLPEGSRVSSRSIR